MIDERNMDREVERLGFGFLGLALVGLIAVRLWRWHLGFEFHETLWSAIARKPMVSRYAWDYGLWELSPKGHLSALSMIVAAFSLIVGATLDRRMFYVLAGCIYVGGYMVNAFLMVKLMAAY